MNNITISVDGQREKINGYINWLFKRKDPFVVLKQFNNRATGVTKMFIALPVRERVFEDSKVNLFNEESLNVPYFPYTKEDIISYTTLYSGNIYDFFDIPLILSKIKFITTTPNENNPHYSRKEEIILFKDYTRSKEEQIKDYTLVPTCLTPNRSVDSVYRLLQTKYVTIVAIHFNNKTNKDGSNTL